MPLWSSSHIQARALVSVRRSACSSVTVLWDAFWSLVYLECAQTKALAVKASQRLWVGKSVHCGPCVAIMRSRVGLRRVGCWNYHGSPTGPLPIFVSNPRAFGDGYAEIQMLYPDQLGWLVCFFAVAEVTSVSIRRQYIIYTLCLRDYSHVDYIQSMSKDCD